MRSWNVTTAEPWRGHFLPYLHTRQKGLNLKEITQRVNVERNREKFKLKEMEERVKVERQGSKVTVERKGRKGHS